MQSTKPLSQAAGEAMSLIDERLDGYRVELLRRLVKLIQEQSSVGGQSSREEQVKREVAALADLVNESGSGASS